MFPLSFTSWPALLNSHFMGVPQIVKNNFHVFACLMLFNEYIFIILGFNNNKPKIVNYESSLLPRFNT